MTSPGGSFDADRLHARLQRLPKTHLYWVGFSGGIDSTALLTALATLSARRHTVIRAVHFNHGLHPEADSWQQHCARFCDSHNIPFVVERLNLRVRHDTSPENAARRERYRVMQKLLGAGEIYLTAHQADDRAETVILNLMRGSGIDGLASIPELRKLGRGWVGRPLLTFTRANLQQYLNESGVGWIEDPSNQDTRLDRNFLRHDVFPALERRWPGIASRLGRTAQHARETIDALANEFDVRFEHLVLDSWTLCAASLLKLTPVFRALLLRHWIRSCDLMPPPRKRLQEFLAQLEAGLPTESAPELRWSGWQLKRHRNLLWLHRYPYPSDCPDVRWSNAPTVSLGREFGVLVVDPPRTMPQNLRIGRRQPGCSIQLHHGGPRRPVKDLLRERGIPPWLRDAVPVLYRNDEALALGDWDLSVEWQEWLSRHQARYCWQPGDELLQKLRLEGHSPNIDRSATVR